MYYVEWHSSMETGNVDIDKQHKHLLQLTNDLIINIDSDIREGEALQTLNELFVYASSHFKEEEDKFRFKDSNDVKKHIEEHTAFLDKLQDFKANIDNNETAEKMARFLSRWIKNHLRNTDTETIYK